MKLPLEWVHSNFLGYCKLSTFVGWSRQQSPNAIDGKAMHLFLLTTSRNPTRLYSTAKNTQYLGRKNSWNFFLSRTRNRSYIYIYILVMSLLPLWIPVSLPGDENTLPNPSHGRVIPRWNRLDKRNWSMKKIPLCAPCAPAARENVFRLLHKPPKNDCLQAWNNKIT